METLQFITGDGEKYTLQGVSTGLISEEGTGIPEIEYITQTGPFQHGSTVLDYFLQPRVLQFTIRKDRCSRSEYWTERQRLINILRPNRGQGTLRKILSDGTKRDLKVYIQQGPSFPSRNEGWDEFAIQEVLRFIAHDPVWYNPTLKTSVFAPVGAIVPTFPLTFPFSFTAYVLSSSINYLGNWIEYPRIRVDGAITNFTLTNTTTGEKLQLVYNLPAGRFLQFDLRYGVKSLLLDDGTNLIPYLTDDSDLATFHLEPGANTVAITGSGIGAGMQVSVYYYDRYIALGGV